MLPICVPEPLHHLASLIEEIGRALQYKHGWKKTTAELLGIHPSTITRLRSGQLTRVTGRLIDSICSRTGISRSYFTENPEGDHVTMFLGDIRTMTSAHWLRLGGIEQEAFALLGRNALGKVLPAEAAVDLARKVLDEIPDHLVAAISILLQLDRADQERVLPEPEATTPIEFAKIVVHHIAGVKELHDFEEPPDAETLERVSIRRRLEELLADAKSTDKPH